MTNITVLNGNEIGDENLKWVYHGEEVKIHVEASGVSDGNVVRVLAEGSHPDFQHTVAEIEGDDIGNVNKTFSVPFDFPGGEDVIFKARIGDKYQGNVYKSGTTSDSEKIYTERDERISELINEQKKDGSEDEEDDRDQAKEDRPADGENDSEQNQQSNQKALMIIIAVIGLSAYFLTR